jgi:hypothetical protein
MDLFDLFWNLRQQQQIGSITAKAALASADVRAQESSIANLSHRFERLTLVTQALFELLSERAHVTEADLMAKIGEIDRRDDARGDRVAGSTRTCPKCGHSWSGRRTTCLYCGATLNPGKPFDRL